MFDDQMAVHRDAYLEALRGALVKENAFWARQRTMALEALEEAQLEADRERLIDERMD